MTIGTPVASGGPPVLANTLPGSLTTPRMRRRIDASAGLPHSHFFACGSICLLVGSPAAAESVAGRGLAQARRNYVPGARVTAAIGIAPQRPVIERLNRPQALVARVDHVAREVLQTTIENPAATDSVRGKRRVRNGFIDADR